MKLGDKVKLKHRLVHRGVLERYPVGIAMKIIALGVGVYDWLCITENGAMILVQEDDIEPLSPMDSGVPIPFKEGWIGRVFYTCDDESLILAPYMQQPGGYDMPTIAQLTEPIVIPLKLLKEIVAND